MSTRTSVNYGDGVNSVETISAARTIASSDHDKTFVLDAAGGATVTLPALTDGFRVKFVVGATFSSTNWVIASAEGDNISGQIIDMGSTPAVVVAGAEDFINFVASAETVGDFAEFVGDAGNSQWLVHGVCAANGGITATDPS